MCKCLVEGKKIGCYRWIESTESRVFWGQTRTNTGREMNRHSNKIKGQSIVLGCDAFTCMKLPLFQNVSYGNKCLLKVSLGWLIRFQQRYASLKDSKV